MRNGRKESRPSGRWWWWRVSLFTPKNLAAGDCRNDGRGVLGGGARADDGVGGTLLAVTTQRRCGVEADLAPGEAKEKERALSGEAPTREGLAAAGSVRVRYQGLRESMWETVKEKREDIDPPPPNLEEALEMVAGSKRREEIRGLLTAAKAKGGCSSTESSRPTAETTAVDAHWSTNGRAPCQGDESAEGPLCCC